MMVSGMVPKLQINRKATATESRIKQNSSILFSVFSDLIDVVIDDVSENEYKHGDEERVDHTSARSS